MAEYSENKMQSNQNSILKFTILVSKSTKKLTFRRARKDREFGLCIVVEVGSVKFFDDDWPCEKNNMVCGMGL